MKSFNKSLAVLSASFALTLGGTVPAAAAGNRAFQEYRSPDRFANLRGLIDRTQSDLRMAVELERGNEKQRNRYRDAQGHLSTLDRDLSKNKFGKGELDKAIGSIKSILDNNVLQASSRDALIHDLNELRDAREYRY